MYLSRYSVARPARIIELDPESGNVLREFKQPEDWRWNPERPHAHWEEYRGRRFFVYFIDHQLIFQADAERFVLDSNYSCEMTRSFGLWIRFCLMRNDSVVYRFTYRDPQTRFWSILSAAVCMDDWWDWDTPFEFVHNSLKRREG